MPEVSGNPTYDFRGNRPLELTTANPPFAERFRRPSNDSRRYLFKTGLVADNVRTLQPF